MQNPAWRVDIAVPALAAAYSTADTRVEPCSGAWTAAPRRKSIRLEPSLPMRLLAAGAAAVAAVGVQRAEPAGQKADPAGRKAEAVGQRAEAELHHNGNRHRHRR